MSLTAAFGLARTHHAADVLDIARRNGGPDAAWFALAAGVWSTAFAATNPFVRKILHDNTPAKWVDDFIQLYEPVPYGPGTGQVWTLFYCAWLAAESGAGPDIAENLFWGAIADLVDFNHLLACDDGHRFATLSDDTVPVEAADEPLRRWATIIDDWADFDHWPLLDILDEHIIQPWMQVILDAAAGCMVPGGAPRTPPTPLACRSCGQVPHAPRCRAAASDRVARVRAELGLVSK
jgi:hypothetical protein